MLLSSTGDIFSYCPNSIVNVAIPEVKVLNTVAYPNNSDRGVSARTIYSKQYYENIISINKIIYFIYYVLNLMFVCSFLEQKSKIKHFHS